MTCVQTTEGIKLLVIGGTAAQKRDIDWDRPQSLYAIGKLAAAAVDLYARLAEKSAGPETRLSQVGIGHENTDQIVTYIGRGFHETRPPEANSGGERVSGSCSAFREHNGLPHSRWPPADLVLLLSATLVFRSALDICEMGSSQTVVDSVVQ